MAGYYCNQLQGQSLISQHSKLAFEKRRKTIKNSLSNIEGIKGLLEKLDIDDQCRAENLSVEKYTNLAKCLVDRKLV